MNMKKTVFGLMIGGLSSVAVADDYRVELAGLYTRSDAGSEYADSKGYAAGARLHFTSVNTDEHPLAEAAYLEKSNNLALTYIYDDDEYLESKTWQGQIEIYIPQAFLYVAPFYEYSASEFFSDFDYKENDWGADIGVTPADGLRISTRWSDEVDYELNLDAKYLIKLPKQMAVNIELIYKKDPFEEADNDWIGAGVDCYLDNTWSIGASFDRVDETGYSLRTRKFFTGNFSLYGDYFFTTDDYARWIVGAEVRF